MIISMYDRGIITSDQCKKYQAGVEESSIAIPEILLKKMELWRGNLDFYTN